MTHVYWADLHNHNEVGYGAGRLERSYDLAQSLLDVYAFSPHTHWPDLPTSDPKTKEKHERGFAKTAKAWSNLESTVRRYYEPGRFVTLLAWEWHSLGWGDYVTYFPSDSGTVEYAKDLDALKAAAAKAGALILPHHVGYATGARGLDWSTLDPELSPVVEVYSEHGSSFDEYAPRSMYGHSMGGVRRQQTALWNLRAGRRFGFTGGTDHHDGYPGSYGFGLTAIAAQSLTREDVFSALSRRRVYAVTGDRIEAELSLGDARFGDVIPYSDAAAVDRRLRFRVRGWAPLLIIELLRNGLPWRSFTQADMQAGSGPANAIGNLSQDTHICRIEWGWDGLGSTAVTRWQGRITVDGAQAREFMPCFAGGAGSVDHTDEVTYHSDGVSFTSHTSRKNDAPVSGFAWRWSGGPDAAVSFQIEGTDSQGEFTVSRRITKRDLMDNDVQISIRDRFTAPKVKVSALVPQEKTETTGEIAVDDLRPGENFMMRITQQNGQMAWISPIWIE